MNPYSFPISKFTKYGWPQKIMAAVSEVSGQSVSRLKFINGLSNYDVVKWRRYCVWLMNRLTHMTSYEISEYFDIGDSQVRKDIMTIKRLKKIYPDVREEIKLIEEKLIPL